jgi:lipoate-protein ligase A
MSAIHLVVSSYTADEHLIARARSSNQPQMRLCRWPETTVVLGCGSRPDVELHVDACAADRVPVVRRRGGGCAVVLDPGNLIVSVALPLPGLTGIRPAVDRITAWLIGGLESCGVAGVRREGISDLAVEDRKIGGSCVYRARDLLYYATTLLCDPALGAIERYIRHPPREPEYRRGREHRDFLGSLAALSDEWNRGRIDAQGRALERILSAELTRLRES